MAFTSAFVAVAMVAAECANALTVNPAVNREDRKPSKSHAVESSFTGPIAWFHVPRCGSSFQFNLLSLDELCHDTSLASDESLLPSIDQVKNACSGIYIPDTANQKSSPRCKGSDDWSLCSEYTAGNVALKNKAMLMGMFRQPEQRMISDYGWALQKDTQGWGVTAGEIGDYALKSQGCAMRMLLDEEGSNVHCGDSDEGPAFKPKERMQEALAVLKQFSFVGLTEEWALSMCLFNKKFGTPCRAEQVQDLSVHINAAKAKDEYDTAVLNGWVDEYDGPIYEKAMEMFEADLQTYDVSEKTCMKCFHDMGLNSTA